MDVRFGTRDERRSREVPDRRAGVVAVGTACAALAVWAAAALADSYVDTVELQIAGNTKLRGTLRSAAERESFRLRLPQGARVAAQVRRKGAGSLVPRVDLVAGNVTLAEGSVKGRGARLASPPLATSGDVAVRIYGNAVDDGDYAASVRVTVQRLWNGGGTSPAGGSALSLSFGAPAGAQARIRVAPAKGSDAVPLLDGITGPGFEPAPLSGAVTGWIPLGDAGTYEVACHDAGGGGDWTWSVQIRAPRSSTASIDISAPALGPAVGGTQQVYGSQVGAAGGTVDPPDLGTALDGASVTVPPGSLGLPVLLSVRLTDPIDVPPPDNVAGPTVRFEPSGTVFGDGAPATVSIPYDRTQFGNPSAELTVYVRDDRTGEVAPILPRSVYDFSVPGIVSFPVAHFSSFVAAGTRPRSAGRAQVVVNLEGGPLAATDTTASTDATWVGDLEYESPARWVVDRFDQAVQWRHTSGEPEPLVFPFTGGLFGSAFPTVTGERSVRVRYGDTVNPYLTTRFVRARNGDVWLNPGSDQAAGVRASAGFALPQVAGAPTRLTLAGRWHLFYAGCDATYVGGADPRRARLGLRGGRASVAIATDGTWRISKFAARESESEFPTGTWAPTESATPTATMSSLVPRVRVDFAPPLGTSSVESSETYDFSLCAGGDVLVGIGIDSNGKPPLVILVRESTNLGPSVLAGTTTQVSYGQEALDAGPGTALQGIRWIQEAADVERTLPRSLVRRPTRTVAFQFDANRVATVDSTPGPETEGTWSLTANGAYSDSSGTFGAVTPSGDFFVGLTSDGERIVWSFAIPREQFGLSN